MPRLTLPNKALKWQSSKELAKQTSGLLNLPLDVQRLIFENVPANIWRSIPICCDGFYYSTKSIEVSLLQVCGQVNAEAGHAMQHGQADQPYVLAFSPFHHFGVTRAILETIRLGRTYDEIYTKRVPKDQKPALAISPLAADLAFEAFDRSITNALSHHFRGDLWVPELSQDKFNTFITQVLLQLRRNPEIELHLHLPKRRMFMLINQYFEWIGPIIAYFVDLVHGNQPVITGTLRFRLTIVSENEEIQHLLQTEWPQSQVGSAKWEVATEQDQGAWDELDKSTHIEYQDKDEESRDQRERAAYLVKCKKGRAYSLI
jgi:hypothetical protein